MAGWAPCSGAPRTVKLSRAAVTPRGRSRPSQGADDGAPSCTAGSTGPWDDDEMWWRSWSSPRQDPDQGSGCSASASAGSSTSAVASASQATIFERDRTGKRSCWARSVARHAHRAARVDLDATRGGHAGPAVCRSSRQRSRWMRHRRAAGRTRGRAVTRAGRAEAVRSRPLARAPGRGFVEAIVVDRFFGDAEQVVARLLAAERLGDVQAAGRHAEPAGSGMVARLDQRTSSRPLGSRRSNASSSRSACQRPTNSAPKRREGSNCTGFRRTVSTEPASSLPGADRLGYTCWRVRREAVRVGAHPPLVLGVQPALRRHEFLPCLATGAHRSHPQPMGVGPAVLADALAATARRSAVRPTRARTDSDRRGRSSPHGVADPRITWLPGLRAVAPRITANRARIAEAGRGVDRRLPGLLAVAAAALGTSAAQRGPARDRRNAAGLPVGLAGRPLAACVPRIRAGTARCPWPRTAGSGSRRGRRTRRPARGSPGRRTSDPAGCRRGGPRRPRSRPIRGRSCSRRRA